MRNSVGSGARASDVVDLSLFRIDVPAVVLRDCCTDGGMFIQIRMNGYPCIPFCWR